VLVEILRSELENLKAKGSQVPPPAQVISAIRALGSLGTKALSAVPVLEEWRDLSLKSLGEGPVAAGEKTTKPGRISPGKMRLMSPHQRESDRAIRSITGEDSPSDPVEK